MRFEYGTKIHGMRRRITTIDGECPRCGSHSLVEYVDYEVTLGCLVCGWKEIDSIEQSIQKVIDSIDNLKQTLERIIDLTDNLNRLLYRRKCKAEV